MEDAAFAVAGSATSITGNFVFDSTGGAAGAAGDAGMGGVGGIGEEDGADGDDGSAGTDGGDGGFSFGVYPNVYGSIAGGETVVAESAGTVNALENLATGSVLLATFTQGTDTEGASNYTATVAWGDGEVDSTTQGPSPISIVVQGQQIEVFGTHTYASSGPMLAIVSLTSSDGGGTALATPTINVTPNITNALGIARSGLVYNRGTRRFGGTLTITNKGTSNLSGSLDVVLTALSSNSTLAAASIMVGNTTYSLTINTVDGSPEIVIPQGFVNDLAPGQSLTISLSFSDPSLGSISYTPTVFAPSD